MPSAGYILRQVLLSSSLGVRLNRWKVDARGLGIEGLRGVSVSKYGLRGGRQEGVDVVEVNNGRIRILIVPTRGMGIWRVESDGCRLGWDSPARELIHPQFINLGGRGGAGWLEGFNEWLARCGLEYAGAPGRDRYIDGHGSMKEQDLTLHGRIANLPASDVEVMVDREPPHRIRVRGRVVESYFSGPNLSLSTEISTVPGAAALRVEDTVTNGGASEQEFQLIYHANYGPPLLGAGARLIGAVAEVVPMNERSSEMTAGYDVFLGPTPGFDEQVYLLSLNSGEEKQTTVMLQAPTGDLASSITFSTEQLPCLTVWKNTVMPADGYVAGVEPGTSFPNNRQIERHFGRVPRLRPGESRSFHLDFAIHQGPDEVREVAQRIAHVQAGRKTLIRPKPIPLPSECVGAG